MGAGWRRFTERLHQAGPTLDRSFSPTPNTRCAALLREAGSFAGQLRKCERAVRAMAAANVEAVDSIRAVMSAPLPLQYEETAAGGGGAAGLLPIGGDAFSPHAISGVMQEAGAKLEVEVLAPLGRWLRMHEELGARHKDLEALRLELDSRRRTVLELSQRVDGLRARLGKGGGGDARAEASLRAALEELRHKEGKQAATAQGYAEAEAGLARDLSTLVADARWLRHYSALALRLEGGALQRVADFVTPAAAPAPPPARQLAAAAAHPAQPPLPDSAGGWGLAVGASMPGPGTPGMAAEAGTWRGATL